MDYSMLPIINSDKILKLTFFINPVEVFWHVGVDSGLSSATSKSPRRDASKYILRTVVKVVLYLTN